VSIEKEDWDWDKILDESGVEEDELVEEYEWDDEDLEEWEDAFDEEEDTEEQ
jgi:hypothetical protein